MTRLESWAALLTAAIVAPALSAQTGAVRTPAKTLLFAAVGSELTQYHVDVDRATLAPRRSVSLPANVQEAVQHRARPYLYVAWSNRGASYAAAPAGGPAGRHGLTAFRISAEGETLQLHGQPVPLRSRPIHVTTDGDGTHVLVAYNDPSGVTVHRLRSDGTISDEVQPARTLDGGIYGHHVRVLPSGRGVVLVTRGNVPTAATPEDPGALKVFSYREGALVPRASIAPNRGFGFQPRHVDFHPSRPWAFLTLEPQNALQVYAIDGDTLGAAPLFSKATLADPGSADPRQVTSSVRVHPSGRFVYVGNRAGATTEFQGRPVLAGGENSVAVFAVDQTSGEPTLVQTIDTRGIYPRTFSLDASGRLLVVGNQTPLAVREGGAVRALPAGLSVFKVGADGRLEFARKYDVAADAAAGRSLFWTGMASLD